MDKPQQRPESMRAIAEAIRSHQQRKPPAKAELDAMEAALLAEIEAFDLQTAPQAPGKVPKPAGPGGNDNPFPAIVPEGVMRASPASAPSLAPAASPAAAPAPGASLLDQLRQQAQSRQQDDASRQQEQAARSRQLDAALRRIFSYCHELVQQLNILHPPVERQYAMPGNILLSGLEWRQGFADYRTRPDSAGAIYELLTLSCQLARPERLRIEREGPAAELFRQTIFEHGLVFDHDEVRNDRHRVEKVIFSIAAEVKINLRWRADPAQGAVILESSNLERFGTLSYAIAPDAVGSPMLDEFTRLLLGQPNRFRDYCRPLAAYSR